MRSLAISVALVLLMNAAGAEDAQTEAEIQFLITSVETSGCEFERNGKTHDGEAAADHLRLKYKRGKRYVDSAEQFIERLATESSWTGRDYYISCPGEPKVKSGEWLTARLEAFRQQPSS